MLEDGVDDRHDLGIRLGVDVRLGVDTRFDVGIQLGVGLLDVRLGDGVCFQVFGLVMVLGFQMLLLMNAKLTKLFRKAFSVCD